MDLVLYLTYVKLTSQVYKIAKAGCLEKSGWFSQSQCLPKKLVYKSVYVSISMLLQNVKYPKNNLPGIALSSF